MGVVARGGEEHLYSDSDKLNETAWCKDNSGYKTPLFGEESLEQQEVFFFRKNIFRFIFLSFFCLLFLCSGLKESSNRSQLFFIIELIVSISRGSNLFP